MGTSRSRGRRGSTNVKQRKEERRQALEKAVATLDRLRLQQVDEVGDGAPTAGSDVAAAEILRARSFLGLAALGQGDGKKRMEQTDKAVEILKAYLKLQPDNTFVRMELVNALGSASLASNNLKGKGRTESKPPHPAKGRFRQDARLKLEEALVVLHPLREAYPGNPSFAMSEIHIRHRMATGSKRRGRLAEAKSQLELAIELQSDLVDAMPDSVSRRCWRALLNCTLAEVLRGLQNPEAATAAIQSAKQTLEALSAEQAKHPMADRLRRSLSNRGAK